MSPAKRKQIDPLEKAIEAALSPRWPVAGPLQNRFGQGHAELQERPGRVL
jgi:septal ring factor EnvC (AmiA/AmiB activator)